MFGTNRGKNKNETMKISCGCWQDRKILGNCEWKAFWNS